MHKYIFSYFLEEARGEVKDVAKGWNKLMKIGEIPAISLQYPCDNPAIAWQDTNPERTWSFWIEVWFNSLNIKVTIFSQTL